MLNDILFITRKFPPKTGGMENMCYNLYKGLSERTSNLKLVALKRGQLNLLWFFPFSIIYTAIYAKKYQTLLIGDGLMCFIGFLSKIFAPKTKRVVLIYGLDILYSNSLYQFYLNCFLKNSADLFICISTETEKALRRRGISNTTVITPGIDTRKEGRKEVALSHNFCTKYGITQKDIILITTGRLVERKGVAWFTKNVMPLLRNQNLVYLVIGSGEDEAKIKGIIEEESLEKQVKMLGRVSDAELKEIYHYAHIFVMPNIKVPNDMEGFGIVAVEASLNGMIVLASGMEGIKDAIIEGKNGFLLESENADCYRDKIVEIINHYESYQEKTEAFAKYTFDHYSWDTICDKYMNKFHSLIE